MASPKHPCAHPACGKMVNKKAVHCQKHRIFTPEHLAKIKASVKGRKPSDETRLKISIARRGDGEINRICKHCGKQFTTDKPSSKVRFCSKRCGYDQRAGSNAKNYLHAMPIYSCRVCGQSFRSPAKNVVRYTCSYTCKNIWQLTHQKNKATNIEMITEKALIERGWEYNTQVALCNIAVVDFFIPENKIVIFCDGDYWHSLPEKIDKDKKQTQILKENGYHVYRFLGSEILSDINSCLNKITNHSSHHTLDK